MWRYQSSEGDGRLLSDSAVTMRPVGLGGSSQWRGGGFHASPPRKSHHHHHQQQQQQVKTDMDEHIIQPKTSVTSTSTSTPATSAATTTTSGKNPNVRLASAVDRYSRVVFPVVFTTFNVAYWAVYINASSSMVNLAEFSGE